MTRSRTATLSLLAAVALAAVLLFYSLRGIDWREVGRLARGANPWRLAISALLASVTLFLRAVRWRVLLNASGDIPLSTAFWATAAGYFGNNFLPARGGEVMRTLMISSRSTLTVAYVLATAFAERAADAVALIVIAGVVLPTVPARPVWLAGAARSFAILGAAAAVAIAVLPRLDAFCRRTAERIPAPARFRAKLGDAIGHAIGGLRAFHDAARFSMFVGLTAVIWTLDAVGTVIGASALGLTLPLRAAFLLMAALGLGSALPSAPAYIGIYQFVAVSVLPPFGLTRTDAIAYILVAQALMYVVIACWGAAGLVQYRRYPGRRPA